MKSVIASPHAQNSINTSEGQSKSFPQDAFMSVQCLLVNSCPPLHLHEESGATKVSHVETYVKEMQLLLMCWMQKLLNRDKQAVSQQRQLIRHWDWNEVWRKAFSPFSAIPSHNVQLGCRLWNETQAKCCMNLQIIKSLRTHWASDKTAGIKGG